MVNLPTLGRNSGFTIVELLIVIVVIGILAAITFVAFGGIQERARVSSAQTTLSQLGRQLASVRTAAADDRFPSSLNDISVNKPELTYSVNTTGTGYCLTYAANNVAYFVTHLSQEAVKGSCVSFNGLLAWLPLNGSAEDMSGNMLPLTSTAVTSSEGQDGRSNGALTFNGTSSSINCGTSTFLRPSTAVTVSAWVKVVAYPGSAHSGVLNNGGGGYWLMVDTTGQSGFYINDGVLLGATLPIGQWKHMTGTYTSGERRLYIDGVQVAADAKTGGIVGYGSEICQIGSNKFIANRYFKGSIDDVRIYNRSLSASEVQQLFSNGAQ